MIATLHHCRGANGTTLKTTTYFLCCTCTEKSNTWKKVEVEISQTEATDLDNKVKEAHAMREITAGSSNEIDKTYNIIMKYWKKLHKVTPESQSDKYLYIGIRRRTPDDLYLLMNRDEVKVCTYCIEYN